MDLDEQVIDWLALQPEEIYLVGGCVRDRLLGRPVCDLDIAVAGNGITLARTLVSRFGGDYFPLDLARSTGRAILRDNHGQLLIVDVARFRGGDLTADLADRDFTINALAASVRAPDQVIDYHGGLCDLESGRIHPVSHDSVRNDPLRALRAIRQAAELDFALTSETEDLIRRDGHLIDIVSGERIRDELSRLLVQPDAAPHLVHLDDLGLLAVVVPELESLRGLQQPPPHYLETLAHSLSTVRMLENLVSWLSETNALGEPGGDVEPSSGSISRHGKPLALLAPFAGRLVEHLAQTISGDRPRLVVLKLAALLHDTGKAEAHSVDDDGRIRFLGHESEGSVITARIMQRLRFSNAETRLVEIIIRHHMRPLLLANQRSVSARAVYRFFRDAGDAGIDVLLHALADHQATYAPDAEDLRWPFLTELTARMLGDFWDRRVSRVAPPPIIDGHDLLRESGLEPGPQIGELLELVREAQVSGEVASREQAIALVRAHLERAPWSQGSLETKGEGY